MANHALKLALALFLAGCKVAIIQPPPFPYHSLMQEHYDKGKNGIFPLTIEIGRNKQPSVSRAGLMYYASDQDGAQNIWVRDLNSTLNFSLIQHPAEQHSPAISPDGKILLFISEDKDREGDLRALFLDSEEMIENVLTGQEAGDVWSQTIDVSKSIDGIFEDDPAIACRGSASEKNPVWHPDGKRFFLVSNRCSNNKEDIWEISLALSPIGVDLKARRLTVDGGTLPAISADGRFLAYIAYRRANSRGELYVLNLETGQTGQFLPEFPGAIPLFPALSGDGSILYYSEISNDSTGDGRIDENDTAVIRAIDIKEKRSRQMIEDHGRIHGLSFVALAESALFYCVEIHKTINIYLLPPQGPAGRKASIQEQMDFANAMHEKNKGREEIAIQAIAEYWQNDQAYAAALGLALASRGQVSRETEKIALQAGEFPQFMAQLQKLKGARRIAELERFSQRVPEYRSPALEALAMEQIEAGQKTEALQTLHLLNQDQKYFRRAVVLKQEGDLLLSTGDPLPEPYLSLLRTSTAPIEDDVYRRLLGAHKQKRTLLEDRRAQEHAGLAALALLLEAHKMARAQADQEALALLAQAETRSKSPAILADLLVLKAQILERTGLSDQALSARQRFSEINRLETGTQEYEKLMKSSENEIYYFRERARLLARAAAALPDEAYRRPKEYAVDLNLTARETMLSLCDQDSRASSIFPNLGPNFRAAYIDYCTRIKNGYTLDLLTKATEANYIISYVTANNLNLFFLKLKQNDLYHDFQRLHSPRFHRIKIDLAMERHRNVLEWERRQKKIQDELESLLLEKDPFDAATFLELEYGYRLALTTAQKAGDNSMLYGYAYTLIQKSVERERFYDGLLESGTVIPDSELIEKKHTMLRDLKTASLYLEYIQNTEPGFYDSYLLQAWLYNYLEYRKARPLGRPFSLYERTMRRLVPFTRSRKPSEGRFFYKVYASYFPDHLFEVNLRTMQKAILIARDADAGPEITASLHLALGNNYYNLQNFNRALQSYLIVDHNLKQGHSPFDGYLPEALFHFHYGTTLNYSGKSKEAIVELHKTHDLFYAHEYQPSQEESATEESGFLSFFFNKEQKPALREQARAKPAMLQALLGMIYSETGQFERASEAFRLAHFRIYSEGSKIKNAIPEDSLFNARAISRQGERQYARSSALAGKAAAIAQKEGLKRNNDPFLPESIFSGILGFFLGYGEDFSVIGEGRTPYGFSSLRRHHLSLGIQLENALLLGDLKTAKQILDERYEFFKSKDNDVILGKEGEIATLNQQGNLFYEARDFRRAGKIFLKAHKRALASGFEKSAVLNLKNAFYALFNWLEADAQGKPESVRNVIKRYKVALDEFKEGYFELSKAQYISAKKIETIGYEYDAETDDPVIRAQLARKLTGFLTIEGSLLYYESLLTAEGNEAREKLQKAADAFLELIALFDKSQEKNSIPYYRMKLNAARALEAEGQIKTAGKLLNDLEESTYEYHLVKESFETSFAQARIAAALGQKSEAEQRIKQAHAFLSSHSEVLDGQDFLRFVASFHIRHKQFNQALQALAQSHKLLVEHKLLHSAPPLNALENVDLVLYRLNNKRLAELYREESQLRLRRQGTEKTIRFIQSARKQKAALSRRLLDSEPTLSIALEQAERFKPAGGQLLIQAFLEGGVLTLWLENGPGLETLSGPADQILDRLESKLAGLSVRETFLIVDRNAFALPLAEMLEEAGLPAPIYLSPNQAGYPAGFQKNQKLQDQKYHIYNTSSLGDSSSDVLLLHSCSIPTRGSSIVFLEKSSVRNYTELLLCYETARMLGASTLALGPTRAAQAMMAAAGKKSYSDSGALVMGSSGFQANLLRSDIQKKADLTRREAKQAYSNNQVALSGLLYARASSIEKHLDRHNLETDLGLLYTKIIQNQDPERELNQVLARHPEARPRIYAYTLESIYRSNNKTLINKYRNAIEKQADPDLALVLNFLYDLATGQIPNSAFQSRWQKAEGAIRKSELRTEAAAILFDHLEYEKSARLGGKDAVNDRILLELDPGPWPEYPAPSGENRDQGYLKLLQEQWQRLLNRQLLELDLLYDTAIDLEKNSRFESLTTADRTYLFRLLLEDYRQTADIETGKQLRKIIAAEKAHARKARMALLACRTAFFIEDFTQAAKFIKKYFQATARSVKASNKSEADLYSSLLKELNSLEAKGDKKQHKKSAFHQIPLSNAGMAVLSQRISGLKTENLLNLIAYIKRRIAHSGDAELLLNVASWENNIRLREKFVKYRPEGIKLVNLLPEDCRFIALVNSGDQVFEISLFKRYWKVTALATSSFRMQQLLMRFSESIRKEPIAAAHSELENIMWGIVGNSTRLTFLWLPERMSFLPLPPIRNLQLYQVLDLEGFTANSLQNAEFTLPFLPASAGKADNADQRLRIMEEQALPQKTGNSIHLFHKLSLLNEGTEPWFISEPILPALNAGKILHRIAQKRKTPGVVTLWKTKGTYHAFFLKFYFDPDNQIKNQAQRFYYALTRLRELFPESMYYGYRLVTGVPVR